MGLRCKNSRTIIANIRKVVRRTITIKKQNFIRFCNASVCFNGSGFRKRRKESNGNNCSTNNRSDYSYTNYNSSNDNYWQKEKDQTSLQGVKAKFAGEDSFLMKVSFSDGKHLYEWVFQKGDKVYTIAIEGTADMINTLRSVFEQSFGSNPKTPGN